VGVKLSEAILLGSVTGPQIIGSLSDRDSGTCALGAALKACGISIVDLEDVPVASSVWPWLSRAQVCPVCREKVREVTYVITNHLNDRHLWSRERIAEWVASVEPKDEQADGGQGPSEVSLEETLCR
jgi:hypothetical protein